MGVIKLLLVVVLITVVLAMMMEARQVILQVEVVV
jgi:hypothetical protein